MLSQIALIFILFIILLSTVLIFVKDKPNEQENFELPTQVAANVPAMNNTEGNSFFVGNEAPEKPDQPIVSSNGLVEFRKMQLLYDGVWGESCKLDGDGNMNCDWKPMNSNCPLEKDGLIYGTDNFFQNPKRLAIGEQKVSPPDCPITSKMYYKGPTYIENVLENPPIYLHEPTIEDITGIPPQDNNLYWNKPGVILGSI